VLMQHGRIIADGSPAQLKSEHRQGIMLDVACSDPDAAMIILSTGDGARDVSPFGGRLHVVVEAADAPEAEAWLRGRLAHAGITVDYVAPIRPTLEDVFIDLVR
jgi:ABC-2 type transport system ATP-binding protein